MFKGLVSVKSVVDEADDTVREQVVKPNQYMKVETVLENGIAQNQVNESKTFSRKILTGIDVVFDTEEESSRDVWTYTQISTSYLRFSAGIKYANLEEYPGAYKPIYVRYNPLIHLFSFLYLEPALDFTPMSSNSYMLRGLANLNFQIFDGFYLGAGYGVSTSDKNSSNKQKYSHGLNATMGYTFADKFFGVIDGVKLSYEIDERKDDDDTDLAFNNTAIVFGIVINFQEGRDRW